MVSATAMPDEDYSTCTGLLDAAWHAARFVHWLTPEQLQICVTMQEHDPGMWRALWEDDFVLRVMRYVREDYFCGFSEEYLGPAGHKPGHPCPGEHGLPAGDGVRSLFLQEYIMWLLQMSVECMMHIAEDALPRSSAAEVDNLKVMEICM